MLTRFISFLKTLYKNRYMIKSFAFADLKKRYAGSFGGLLWSVVNPLMFILTYYFVFSVVLGVKAQADSPKTSFTLWLIGGLLPWFFFSETVLRSTGALQENKSLITKTLFPSEIIPVCLIVSNTINHLIMLVIFFIFAVVLSGGVSPLSIFFPVYFVLMSVMVLGFSWALASLNVFARDIGQLVGIVMNLWFFYTPIIFPIGSIPDKYKIILKVNPMYHVVEGYRNSLVLGRYPEPYHLVYLVGFSGAAFVVGGLLYKRLKPAFADVL